jgi:hypothetical protein
VFESLTHKNLVKSMKSWIEENYRNEDLAITWIDNYQEEGHQKVKRIENFIPDIFAVCLSNKREIIGEAKTAFDIESKHSEEQLLAFLRYCEINKRAMLILIVPWDFKRYAKAFIELLKKENQTENANTIVIDNLRPIE